MTHTQLTCTLREVKGNSLRKLRKNGVVPAVIYSKSLEPILLQMPFSDFLKTYKSAGKTQVIDMKVEGKKIPCIIHDIDVHPVKGIPRHVDFLAVNLKEKVTTDVPIVLIGDAPAVKEQGGVLVTPIDTLEVTALPDQLPEQINVSIDKLANIGDAVRVEDIPSSKNYVIETLPDTVVASVVAQQEEIEEEQTLDGEVGDSAVSEKFNTENPS